MLAERFIQIYTVNGNWNTVKGIEQFGLAEFYDVLLSFNEQRNNDNVTKTAHINIFCTVFHWTYM